MRTTPEDLLTLHALSDFLRDSFAGAIINEMEVDKAIAALDRLLSSISQTENLSP